MQNTILMIEPESGLFIDLSKGIIVNKGIKKDLSAQEIKLLDYFYQHKNTIISREELLSSVWNYESNISTRTLDVHVSRLRKKMGDNSTISRYIQTIRGVGYRFTPSL